MGTPSWQRQARRRIFVRSSPHEPRAGLACSLVPKVQGTFWAGSSPVRQGTLQGRFPPARLLHPGGARGASSRYELPFPAWNPPGDGAADQLVNFSKIAESLSSPCALADRE
jgi:hypothetical protein